ncbi:MAG: efflux RND transporter periplasmic adaptor subunit [Deltaproteobacteria bacterium]
MNRNLFITHSGIVAFPDRMHWTFAFLALLGLMSGCSEPEKPPPPPTEVTVMQVQPKDTPVTFEFVGMTESSQQVEVRARVEGFLEERLYTEGSIVKKGQVMFKMDRKPFEAQLDSAKGALAQQKARLWTARANLKRIIPLAKANALSKKDRDDAQGQFNAAAAAVDMAQADVETAELNLGYTTIYAPVTGISSFSRIQEGAYLNPANSLLTYVAHLDPIWVNFSISEDEMLKYQRELKSGRLASAGPNSASVEIVMADGSVFPEIGRLFFKDANYSTETGTFLVRATVPNPKGGIRPGQFVRARIKGTSRPNAILVPQQAVLQGAKGFFVWIVDQDGKAQIRNVEVGDWQNDNWFVFKGLSAGESVITDGIVHLSVGKPVKILAPDAGHVDGQPNDGKPDVAPAGLEKQKAADN